MEKSSHVACSICGAETWLRRAERPYCLTCMKDLERKILPFATPPLLLQPNTRCES